MDLKRDAVATMRSIGTDAKQVERKGKIADYLVAAIRAAMIDGRLNEGDRLPPEPDLIALLGVSRGVVREVLKLLESQRLVEIRRGQSGGAVVHFATHQAMADAMSFSLQMSKTTLMDYFVANRMLVPRAARLAAQLNAEEAGRVLLANVALQQELKAAGQAEQLAIHNNDFNALIIANCGNSTLKIIGTPLRLIAVDHISRLHHLFSSAAGDDGYLGFIQRALDANAEVAELISQGQGTAAEVFWERHMERAGEFFFHYVPVDYLMD